VCKADAVGVKVYEGGLAASAVGAKPAPANARPTTATYPNREFIRASFKSLIKGFLIRNII
jgi:hypothetical protein